MILPWFLARSRTEVENRIFALKTRTHISPRTGREHEFYVLEADDWVNVVPLTPEGRVLLVRQFRHATREVTIEIPGGLIEAGQTPEEAAARELLEETGYAAVELTCLGRVRPNPAILTNWCYTFLARDVFQVSQIQTDETEELELVELGLDRIQEMMVSGEIDHALVLSAFVHFYLHQKNKS